MPSTNRGFLFFSPRTYSILLTLDESTRSPTVAVFFFADDIFSLAYLPHQRVVESQQEETNIVRPRLPPEQPNRQSSPPTKSRRRRP